MLPEDSARLKTVANNERAPAAPRLSAPRARDARQKLAELYRYEAARDPGHFADAVYNANAHVLLHDDNCFRLEARGGPGGGDGSLTVQLLDPDRTEVTAGAPAPALPRLPRPGSPGAAPARACTGASRVVCLLPSHIPGNGALTERWRGA